MKITNALIGPARLSAQEGDLSRRFLGHSGTILNKPWYWEGNVQAEIVRYLTACNASVLAQANTSTREQGKDIEAIDNDGTLLWVTVKGFPQKSKNTQARHWFAGTLLDLALYKDQRPEVRLALGLPSGFSTYDGLTRRVRHTLAFFGCHIFWVNESGTVTREIVKSNTPPSVKEPLNK